MSWTLLAPASAIMVTICAFGWALHRVELEVAALRRALRRSRAAGVAIDQLERDSTATVEVAQRIGRDARIRADLRRNRHRSAHR